MKKNNLFFDSLNTKNPAETILSLKRHAQSRLLMRTIIWVFNWDRKVKLCGGGRTSPSLSGWLKKAQICVQDYYKQLIKVVWFESFHCVPIPSRVPNYPIYPSWDWVLKKKKKKTKTLHCHSWNHTYHFPVDFFQLLQGFDGSLNGTESLAWFQCGPLPLLDSH